MKTLRLAVSLSVVVVSAALASVGAAAVPAPKCVPVVSRPVVGTGVASGVSSRGATLGGVVDPRGCATTFRFQYGPTAAYGRVTVARSAGSGAKVLSVSQAVAGLLPGAVYHFRIVATSAAGSGVGHDRAFRTSAAPKCVPVVSRPVVGTGVASGVSSRGATLGGVVDPRGCATTFRFQYGPTAAYGRVTVARSAGSGAKVLSVSQAVAGLLPGAVYHFRIVATSAAGSGVGHDRAFRTSAAPACVGSVSRPVVGTGVASGVSSRGATLGGVVDPRGCATTFRFQYGPTAAYGRVTVARSAGSGAKVLSVSQAVAGLLPGAVYHFRIVATSAAGSGVGHDRAFRTSAAPVPSFVVIVGGRAPVRRGFVARIRLRCAGTSGPCVGTLKIFRNARLIGRRHFFLVANTTKVVRVKLNRRGRRLMRQHRTLRVNVVASSTVNTAQRGIRLIRRFPLH